MANYPGVGTNLGYAGYSIGGGGPDYTDILGQLTKVNPLTNALYQGGSALLGGLAGLFKGKSDAQKSAAKVFNLAQNRLGQDVLHPEQYLADYMRALAPQWERDASTINSRLNLDSGTAQSELARNRQSVVSQFFLNAKMQNDELKAQQNDALLALMGEVGRYK